MARPFKEINWEEFDKLCRMQCTRKEIAAFFECDEKTISAAVEREKGISYSLYSEEKAAEGKQSLRRKQLQVAMGGNVTMLIWLGKQYLGQSDKSDIATETKGPINLIWRNGNGNGDVKPEVNSE